MHACDRTKTEGVASMVTPTLNEWESILSRYEKSDLTQKAFCAENDIKYSQFKNYLHRRKIKSRTAKPNLLHSLIPIKVKSVPAKERDSLMTLVLPNGFQIKINASIDMVRLKQLIELVRTC